MLDQDLETIVRQYKIQSARPLSATDAEPSAPMAIEKIELAAEKLETAM